MNKKLISIQNLTIDFHTLNGRERVLKNLSLDIYPSEKVALVGESGSGKSLTIRTILGILDAPNVEISGKIIYNQKNLLENTEKEWKKIRGKDMSMIFQDPTSALNPTYTLGKQIIDIIMSAKMYKNRAECRQAVINEMRKISINDPERVLQSYPFQLSGGLNQRITIIMALLNNPKLLLADEPGTALDVTVQAQTLKLMNVLIKEKKSSCLFISHNLGVVRSFADVVYVIHKGRIVESATTQQLFKNPQHPYTQALIKAVPTLDKTGFMDTTYDVKAFYNAAPVHHSCMKERETQNVALVGN